LEEVGLMPVILGFGEKNSLADKALGLELLKAGRYLCSKLNELEFGAGLIRDYFGEECAVEYV
jgi:hypothetical protein